MNSVPQFRALLDRLHARKDAGQYKAQCLAHADSDDPERWSLSLNEKDGRILLHCFAGCDYKSIVAAMDPDTRNLLEPQIVAIYDYLDESSSLLSQVLRYSPKNFKQRKPDGKGAWTWKLGNVRRVPYHLPEILAATTEIFICEGEKDCDTLKAAGLVSTTNPGGAGKWRSEYSEYLRGKDVVIIPDADEPGRKHALEVATSLHLIAASVKIIQMLPVPGDKVAKDVSDWFAAGMNATLLRALAEDTPRWMPSESATTAPALDWPDPQPLQQELLPVPPFDVTWLPTPFCEHVAEISDLMQLPPDFAATATLVSIAGAVGRRVLIQPKLLDTRWQESLNLSAVNVGAVGTLKSPTMNLITAPLSKIQTEWMRVRQVDQETYEREAQVLRLEKENYEAALRNAIRTGAARPVAPDFTLWEPLQRRLITVDATYEKLQKILQDNVAGVLCLRDELIGLLADVSKPGRESERSFWLTLLNGKGLHIADRIGRETCYTENVSGSLLGNVVPSRLKHYLSSVLSGGCEDDGFFSRLLMSWPDLPVAWQYTDRAPNGEIAESVERIYRIIVRLSASDPLVLRFSPAAQEIFKTWLEHLEHDIRSGRFSPALTGHYAKYRKFLPTICGLYEVVDRAIAGDLATHLPDEIPYPQVMRTPRRRIHLDDSFIETSDAMTISQANMERAVETCGYYMRHASRVYNCIASAAVRAGNALAKQIVRAELQDGFTAREVLRRNWTDLTSGELVAAGLEHLSDLHWIRATAVPSSARGGRPTEKFSINPKVERKQA